MKLALYTVRQNHFVSLIFGPVPDLALRGSELNGFAGKEGELFWSNSIADLGMRNADCGNQFEYLTCIL
jgi:hypothetical protein